MRRLLLASLLALTTMAAAPDKAKVPPPPTPLGDPMAPDGCLSCETYAPRAYPGDGEMLVAWHGLHDDTHVVLDRFTADGPQGNVATLSGNGNLLHFAGAVRDGEGWLASWWVGDRISIRRFDAGGAAGPEVEVNSGRPPGASEGAVTISGRDGRALVAWARSQDIHGINQLLTQMHDGGGGRVSGPEVVFEGYGYLVHAACARPDGSTVMAWQDQIEPTRDDSATPKGLVFGILDAEGRLARGPFRLVAPGALPAELSASPSVACAGDGSFAVIWHTNLKPLAKQGFDVVWQRFDAAGKPKGKAARVNSGLGGDQVTPRLLARGDGSYLATWVSREANPLIEGRRLGGNGKAQGNDFLLYGGPTESRYFGDHTTAAPVEGGGFVLAWWQDLSGRMRWFRD
ncbi:MAG TPA: hypothetical protein VN923_12860 [Thermoanaerobaculia bacterium]|nr:hypothetical protein [Thermoanaerobaculia bacterium]